MPVKIEHLQQYCNMNTICYRYSPTPVLDPFSFSFNEVDDLIDGQSSLPLEFPDPLATQNDLWSNLIITPPQSPPTKLIDDTLEAAGLGDVISRDCMWSGAGEQSPCKSTTSSFYIRPETPFNLSTSPQNGFSYISSYDMNINDNGFIEDDNTHEQQPQQPQPQQSMDGNIYAMTNDHSYGSAQKFETKEKSLIRKDTIYRKNSMDNGRSAISQPKISKVKCKKTKRTSANSILNSNVANIGSKKENSNTSVIKPTIISVTSYKNVPDLQTKCTKRYLSMKQKKLLDGSRVSSSTQNRVIQVKNMIPNHHVASTMNSPSCSDSEESSLSFASSGDVDKNSPPPVKRREHNDSERKRRDHLRNSFNNLRDQIPKLKESEKRPPRIMILHEATTYVKHLIQENDHLERIYKQEQEKRNRLLEILKRSTNSESSE